MHRMRGHAFWAEVTTHAQILTWPGGLCILGTDGRAAWLEQRKSHGQGYECEIGEHVGLHSLVPILHFKGEKKLKTQFYKSDSSLFIKTETLIPDVDKERTVGKKVT